MEIEHTGDKAFHVPAPEEMADRILALGGQMSAMCKGSKYYVISDLLWFLLSSFTVNLAGSSLILTRL